MADEVLNEGTSFRRSSWGPVRTISRRRSIEVRVGDAVIELGLDDHRPALERQAEPWRSVFEFGVPVLLAGEHVATVTEGHPGGSSLLRRSRYDVTGDDAFVLPGMVVTQRSLPKLLTLRCDAGVLVSSRRWATPVNTAVRDWAMIRDTETIPPRVTADTRPEHIALWMALSQRLNP